MSINALEKALWQVYQNPTDTELFRTDAGAYVKGFNLAEEESSMLKSFDSMAMIAHGANPMLVMMAFQTAMGMERFPEYFATVNQ